MDLTNRAQQATRITLLGAAVNATLLHDIPVVQAITLIFAIVIIITNLIVEILYARLNVKEMS